MESLGHHYFKSSTIAADTYVVPVTSANLTFNDNGGSPDTITRAAGDFTADGFAAGQVVRVGGTQKNNGLYVITAAAALTLTVATGSFTQEGPVATSLIGANAGWTFWSQGLQFLNRGTDALFYSFDGATDHGRIAATSTQQFHCRHANLVWFRRDSGAGSNVLETTVWG